MADDATPDGPARRRESWSIKTIVEEVSGRPITDFQDPGRPPHPYLKVKMGASSTAPAPRPAAVVRSLPTAHGDHVRVEHAEAEELDPAERLYPPLRGATAREVHGPSGEHHAATLATVAHPAGAEGSGRRPSPSARPERVYLHYLLMHLDRLNDSALRYLRHSVEEELRHRASETPTGP